jgi:hypothetical protein
VTRSRIQMLRIRYRSWHMPSNYDLATIAPSFVQMAHRIVWATVATVDHQGRPRSRILHPVWVWDGETLTGWIGTGPTTIKHAHLSRHPFASCSYWSPSHDACVAECRAELLEDAATRHNVWSLLKSAPEPVGYDPAIVPGWGPDSPTFAGLRLTPWRLRVFPGTVLLGQGGRVLTWQGRQ